MTGLIVAWAVLNGIVTIIWIFRHYDITCATRRTRRLSSTMFDAPPNPAPRVSVIVAAKDEQDVIEPCVRTILDQDYPDFELIVVNDRSHDDTLPILHTLETQSNRLRVHHVTELPKGWFGKPNAVRTGVDDANGDYLLFVDADCEMTSTRTIATAMRYAAENGIEFLSVLPVITPSCVLESLLQPVCTGVLMMWHNPEKVNNPKRSKAYANGAFMLIRRDAYDRIGGHHAVRNALCEDMQLARHAKAAGVRLYIIQNTDLYTTRMYANFAQIWRGWTRIFQGSLQYPSKILLAAFVLFLFSVMPVASALIAAARLIADVNHTDPTRWAWTTLLITSTTAVIASQSVMLRFYRLLGTPIWKSLTYPPAAIVSLGILANALRKVLGFGSTTWRGTTYASQTVRPPQEPAPPESPAHAG